MFKLTCYLFMQSSVNIRTLSFSDFMVLIISIFNVSSIFSIIVHKFTLGCIQTTFLLTSDVTE